MTSKEEREKRLLQMRYRNWFRQFGRFVADKNEAIEWAQKVLANPQNYTILDTETTGLHDAQIVEIAVVDATDATLLNSLVKPSISIPAEASRIHGISDAMVADAPTFPEIYAQIVEALEGRQIIIYNSGFDTRILNYCCQLHNLPPIEFGANGADCASAGACPVCRGLERISPELQVAKIRRRAPGAE